MSCKLTDVDIPSCAPSSIFLYPIFHLPPFHLLRKSGANGGASREEEGRHGGWHEGHRSCGVPPGIYLEERGKGGGAVSDQYVEKRREMKRYTVCYVLCVACNVSCAICMVQ